MAVCTGRRRGWMRAAGALIGLCVMTACSAASPTTSAAAPSPTRPASGEARTATVCRPARPPRRRRARAPHWCPWRRSPYPGADRGRLGRDRRDLPRPRALRTAQRQRGPRGPAAGLVGPARGVGGSERRHLLAAFTGGFMLNNHVGGYEQEGHVISPLQRGVASLVIDRSGQARLGIWGHGVPAPGEAVYSVLQNLRRWSTAGGRSRPRPSGACGARRSAAASTSRAPPWARTPPVS